MADYKLTYGKIDRDLLKAMEAPGRTWYILLAIAIALVALGGFAFSRQIRYGMGVWGLTHPTMWAIDITNFVFWVGIAHSGTLISAVLFLFRVRWRASIYRAAEAVIVIAFELTILFRAIGTLLGLLINARFPRLHIAPAFHPRFCQDQFGLFVFCAPNEIESTAQILRDAGAAEVRQVESDVEA
jgi:hypothetical protein